MNRIILELVGVAFGLAALGCFVAAAFSISTVIGTLALGGAFFVAAVTAIVVANRPPSRRPPT